MQESNKKCERKERVHEWMSPKKDLTIELPDGRESAYHRLN